MLEKHYTKERKYYDSIGICLEFGIYCRWSLYVYAHAYIL